MTADLEGALDAYQDIAGVSRIAITGIINNTHLKEETVSEMMLEGQLLAEKLADKLSLQVDYISGTPENLAELPAEYDAKKFPIQFYINLKF